MDMKSKAVFSVPSNSSEVDNIKTDVGMLWKFSSFLVSFKMSDQDVGKWSTVCHQGLFQHKNPLAYN